MARHLAVALLLVAATALALAEQAEQPEVCSSDYKTTYEVTDGNVTGDDGASAAAEQLAAWVAQELHKDEECEVTAAQIIVACSKVGGSGNRRRRRCMARAAAAPPTPIQRNLALFPLLIYSHPACPCFLCWCLSCCIALPPPALLPAL